jgi:hypothetical protein
MRESRNRPTWIPAFAGMTDLSNDFKLALSSISVYWTLLVHNLDTPEFCNEDTMMI